MIRKRALILVFAAVLMLVGLRLLRSGSDKAQLEALHPAFTAIVHTVATDASGKQTGDRLDQDVYLSDGSSIHKCLMLDGKPSAIWDYVDKQKNVRVVVDPYTKSITTYKIKANQFRLKPESCRNNSTPVSNVVGLAGHPVYMGTEEHGSMSRVFGAAQDLECYLLTDSTNFKDATGKLVAHVESRVLSVTMGATSRTERQAPTGYTERAPSEVLQLANQMKNQACPECELKTFPVLDQVYHQR